MRPTKRMERIKITRRRVHIAGTILFAMLTLIIMFLGVAFNAPGVIAYKPEREVKQTLNISNAPTIYTEEDKQYYDIPLSEELQDYIFSLAEQYEVPTEVIIAVIATESSYRPGVVGKAGEQGFMQIHPINFKWLTESLGVTDFSDPKQNILCGVYMLSKLYSKYDTRTEVLMCYNCGETGAKRLWAEGVTSTAYTQKIDTAISNLEIKEAYNK